MVIHWETIVTKVHSQMLMAMKSGQMLMAMKSGCKILHVTVKHVATLFVPHLSNLPPVALDPAYMFLHILRCLKVASFLVPIMTKFLPHLWSYIYLYRIKQLP